MNDILNSKLFIVDDDIFNCNVYLKHLSNLGYTDVTTYTSGVECINHLTDKPEIILLDYQMDQMNGFETLKKIKRFDPSIFIIVVSAQTNIDVAINSLKYGAFDYIKKGTEDLNKIKNALDRIAQLKSKMNEENSSLLAKIFNR